MPFKNLIHEATLVQDTLFLMHWLKAWLESICTCTCINRPSDRVGKKIKNYAGIFRYIMRKNTLITWKTRWIMRKFKQFITLIIVPFQCFVVM